MPGCGSTVECSLTQDFSGTVLHLPSMANNKIHRLAWPLTGSTGVSYRKTHNPASLKIVIDVWHLYRLISVSVTQTYTYVKRVLIDHLPPLDWTVGKKTWDIFLINGEVGGPSSLGWCYRGQVVLGGRRKRAEQACKQHASIGLCFSPSPGFTQQTVISDIKVK